MTPQTAAPEEAPSTLSKSERTRQLLLDHAVAEIRDVGVDRLSFTSIAKRAELTTGSLYSRYENQTELLVDVWEARCEDALHQLLNLIADSLTTGGEKSRREVARILNAPSAELCVALQLLVVSRRIDEIAEVAIPWFVLELRDGTLVSETDQFQYIVAIFLGSLLVLFGNTAEELDWTEFCEAAFAAWATMPDMAKVDIPVFTVKLSDGHDMDPFDFRLVQATLDIVAKTGFERATVSRIARRSGVNPASLYQHHADKEALLLHAIGRAVTENIRALTTANRELFNNPSVDFHLIGMGIAMALLEPNHKRTRQIRLELHLASAHNKKISEYLTAQTTHVVDEDVKALQVLSGAGNHSLRNFSIAMRGLISGLAALHELGVLDTKVQPNFLAATDSSVISKFLTKQSS